MPILPAQVNKGKKVRGPNARAISRLFNQFDRLQWWPRVRIEERQFKLLTQLVRHAVDTVPWYKQHVLTHGWDVTRQLTPETYRQLPVLTRKDVQEAGDRINSNQLPRGHGRISTYTTSGSTGRPITVRKASIDRNVWSALTLRETMWNQRDMSESFAYIRHLGEGVAPPPDGAKHPNWNKPFSHFFRSAPSYFLDIRCSTQEHFEWLQRTQPAYLMTTPSVIDSMARLSLTLHVKPEGLRQICTIGEALSPDTRELVEETWGIKISDIYSAAECGYIALQAPGKDYYLVQSESIYLEILDENNQPCSPGQTGRIVVTPLYNYATPLLRYELGDHAEAGSEPECGRGVHVINHIKGRTRNMLAMPDGTKRFPSTGIKRFNMANDNRIKQFQVIQKSLQHLVVNLVMDEPFNISDEALLIENLRSKMKYPFNFQICYVDEIPRSASGKFEQFRSEIPNQ